MCCLRATSARAFGCAVGNAAGRHTGVRARRRTGICAGGNAGARVYGRKGARACGRTGAQAHGCSAPTPHFCCCHRNVVQGRRVAGVHRFELKRRCLLAASVRMSSVANTDILNRTHVRAAQGIVEGARVEDTRHATGTEYDSARRSSKKK